jgi:hypothetical protein
LSSILPFCTIANPCQNPRRVKTIRCIRFTRGVCAMKYALHAMMQRNGKNRLHCAYHTQPSGFYILC